VRKRRLDHVGWVVRVGGSDLPNPRDVAHKDLRRSAANVQFGSWNELQLQVKEIGSPYYVRPPSSPTLLEVIRLLCGSNQPALREPDTLAARPIQGASSLDRFETAVARPRAGSPRGLTGLLMVALFLVAACARGRPVASSSPTPLEDVPSLDRFLPPTYEEDGKVVMPVTFPDGTNAEILYAPYLDLAGTNIHPYTSAVGPGVSKDFDIVYGEAEAVLRLLGQAKPLTEYPDGRGGTVGFWRLPDADYLAFQFGSWAALVRDSRAGESRMSEEQRALWSSHLHGREVAGGWLTLEAEPPLTLARAGKHAGPELGFLIPGTEYREVLLVAGPCKPVGGGEGQAKEDIQIVDGLAVARTKDVNGEWYAIWCDPSVPMRVDVYSGKDETLIDAVVADLEIRSGSPELLAQ
jgi:hypothetical protein